MYHIYMVGCEGGSIYTGIAIHLQRRLREHVNKAPTAAKYTRSHAVISLECVWRAEEKGAALRLERAIKGLRREEKLQLIAAPERMAQLLPQLSAQDYIHVPGITLEDCLKGETPCT